MDSLLELDFENDLPPHQVSPWQLWATSNGSSSIVLDNGPSQAGGKAVELAGFTDYGWYADLTGQIDPSKDYIFEFDVKPVSGGQTVSGAVFIDGERVDGAGQGGFNAGVWTTVRMESDLANGVVRRYLNGVLNAVESPVQSHSASRYPNTVDYVTFGGSNNGHNFVHRFDNVRLTIIPEPTTAVIGLALLLGPITTCRRNRR